MPTPLILCSIGTFLFGQKLLFTTHLYKHFTFYVKHDKIYKAIQLIKIAKLTL